METSELHTGVEPSPLPAGQRKFQNNWKYTCKETKKDGERYTYDACNEKSP